MKIFPSILSADFACLKPGIESLVDNGIDRLHLDVMDGHFVPNISFGFPVIESVADEFPQVKLDAHLMIEQPAQYLDPLLDIGVDWVSVHTEVDPPVDDILRRLHDRNVKAGIALNPDTPVEDITDELQRFDYVLLMTVQPGFGGQAFREDVLEKIDVLKGHFDGPIQLDGGIGEQTIGRAAEAGAEWFVSGSSVFGNPDPARACETLLTKAKGSVSGE